MISHNPTKKSENLFLRVIYSFVYPLLNDRAELDGEPAAANDGGAGDDDYFTTHSTLVDELTGEPIEETESIEPTQKGDKTGTTEKPNTQKGDGKSENPFEGIPEGLHERLFNKTEDGNMTFKAEEALNFMLPDKDSDQAFRYSPIPVISDEQAKTRQAGDQPQAPKSYKDELLEMEKNIEEAEEKLNKPLAIVANAIDQGYTPEQALQLAKNEIAKIHREYSRDQRVDFQSKHHEGSRTSQEEAAKRKEITQQATINEAQAHQWFGGKDVFESVFFAHKNQKGEMVPGLASQDLWALFQIANPGIREKQLTGKELQNSMVDWWPKFASDMNNLKFLRRIGMAALFEKTRPHLFDAVRKQGARSTQAKREGTQHRTGGLRTPAKKGGSADPMAAFLNPVSDDSVAVI